MSAFGWPDYIQILIFWIGIYLVLRSLRRTRGLGVLKGCVGIVLGLYLFSRLLENQVGIELSRLEFAIEHLITVALIAFVIIFQPELRRGLTRLGEKPFSWLSGPAAGRSVSPIVEAAGHMSRRRIGALIVVERSVGISGIIESGVPLSAEVTAPLLESIFYPNAPLHDGAVVVRGSRVVAASCLLPLSDNPELGPEVGTRHRAAVGLAEETDSIVVVVSEQTGRISIAHHSVIRPMRDMRELASAMQMILDGAELEPAGGERLSADSQEIRVSSKQKGAGGPGGSEPAEEESATMVAAVKDRSGFPGGEPTVRIELPAKDKATSKSKTDKSKPAQSSGGGAKDGKSDGASSSAQT